MRLRLAPEPALSLAALRVVVPAMILAAPGFRHAREVAAFEPARRVAPEGLVWFAAHAPVNPTLALGLQLVAATAAVFAIAGMRARLSLAVLTLSATYLFAIADLAGFVWHEVHLLWFCALLAVSPCDHVLAVDSSQPLTAHGQKYAAPLWCVRLLLGVMYFFPGYHKLRELGLDWALGDNLSYQLYWKWVEHSSVPSIRLDQHPIVLATGGLAALAFELSFIALVCWRRTRPFAAAAGLAFHLSTQIVFRIPFASIWLCYVALVDLRPAVAAPARWMRRIARRQVAGHSGADEPIPPRPDFPAWVPVAVGAALLCGAAVQGVRGQTQSFPFACYPTFQYKPGPTIPDLVIVRRDATGRERIVPHARNARGYRSQRQWAEIWSLAGATAPLSPARLRAYYASLVRQRAAPGASTRTVIFYRADRSVRPEDRDRPPVRQIELYAFSPH